MEFDEVIKKRQSIRHFKSKKPDWRDIVEAINSARQAPAAGNLHCIKFILVDDKKKINKLAEASQQDFVAEANYVIVVCSDLSQVVRSYDERGEVYARQQAGAAIENFLLKITDVGLSSCWVGAFVDEQVRNILAIPDNINVDAILPVGYSMDKSKQPRKPDFDKYVYFNKWENKYMKPIKNVEAF